MTPTLSVRGRESDEHAVRETYYYGSLRAGLSAEYRYTYWPEAPDRDGMWAVRLSGDPMWTTVYDPFLSDSLDAAREALQP